ncbi:hypothetical protein [Treponema sp. R80B11-R83G3]
MKTKLIGIALAVCTLLAFVSCHEKVVIPVEKLTQDGYFILQESNEKGRYGPVVIFPERHNSRLIQAEIGWALNILLENCGINTIALEGMFDGETMTGGKLAFSTETAKYEVLLSALENGSIKAPEFMYLAKDSFVFGIEDKAEYAVTMPDTANRALVKALLMSIVMDKGVETYNQGVDSYNNNEIDFNALISLNPWTFETYEIMIKGNSLTETSKRLAELEEKTASLLDTQTKAGLKQLKIFYDTAYQRSGTMSSNVYQKLKKNNKPLAMIIGAAHTEDITAYFNKNKVKYYVLEPSGLNMTNVWSDLTNEEYKRKEEGKSLFNNEQIRVFFGSVHNPRPTFKEVCTQSQFKFTSLIGVVIDGASSNPPVNTFSPDMLFNDGLRIVAGTIDISNPADIKFCMESTKGERLYVRMIKNVDNYKFGGLENALKDMVERLEQINKQTMPFEQRIQEYRDIIEVFNFKGYIVLFSPEDIVNKINN